MIHDVTITLEAQATLLLLLLLLLLLSSAIRFAPLPNVGIKCERSTCVRRSMIEGGWKRAVVQHVDGSPPFRARTYTRKTTGMAESDFSASATLRSHCPGDPSRERGTRFAVLDGRLLPSRGSKALQPSRLRAASSRVKPHHPRARNTHALLPLSISFPLYLSTNPFLHTCVINIADMTSTFLICLWRHGGGDDDTLSRFFY